MGERSRNKEGNFVGKILSIYVDTFFFGFVIILCAFTLSCTTRTHLSFKITGVVYLLKKRKTHFLLKSFTK